MPWPKTFPNPEWVSPTDNQWRPVPGRPGVFTHDDVPTQEVEIILHQCASCGHEQQTMHSLGASASANAQGVAHVVATVDERRAHSRCPAGHQMKAIGLAESKKDKTNHFGRDTIGIGRT